MPYVKPSFAAFLVALMANAQTPTRTVLAHAFQVSSKLGSAVVPLEISRDWSRPQPGVTRAVIVFHGKGRNASEYYHDLAKAADRSEGEARRTILIAPQFLDEEDIDAHDIRSPVLRWRHNEWEAGSPASGPIPLSTFDVADALIERLDDSSLFPNMRAIVLAGHSGGAQLVQRYAVVGRAAAAHESGRIHIRYVVANPSSYLYFSEDRPAKDKSFAVFDSERCAGFDHWKYGPVDPPAYVHLNSSDAWRELEENYAKRDVIYLLGTADTDPHQKDLDTSCSGEAEGPNRFVRGKSYFAYLHTRHPSGWNQRMWFVNGVAHSANQMINSKCGLAAIFDIGSCPDQ
jgi:hypothetical protein